MASRFCPLPARHLFSRWLAALWGVFAVVVGCAVTPDLSAAVARTPEPNSLTRSALLLLKAECFSCHNEEKKKGGLVLSTPGGLAKGGDEGPVVTGVDPDASKLIRFLARESDPHMPPKKQLAGRQVKILRDWIAAGSPWDDAVLREEDPPEPVELAAGPSSYQPVQAIAVSPDGRRLAFGRGGVVWVHDATLTNFPVIARLEAHLDAVQCLAWSPDGAELVSGAFRRMRVWGGPDYRLVREFTNGWSGRLTAVRFLPGGNEVVAADGVPGRSGMIRIANRLTGRVTASWRAHEDSVLGMDLSPDGRQLVTGGADRWIKIWEVGERRELVRMEGHTAQVLGVAFNSNATQVVSCGADKQLRVWDVATREKILNLGNHLSGVAAVLWPRSGTNVVAGTDGGGVYLYRNLTNQVEERSSRAADEIKLGEAGDLVSALASTPDAGTIFAGSQDGVVRAWRHDGTLLRVLAPTPDSPVARTGPGREGGSRARSIPVAARLIPAGRGQLGSPVTVGTVVSLFAQPSRIEMSAEAARHGLLITARTDDGFEVDVTAEARFSTSRRAPFEIAPSGELVAVRPGAGVVTAHFRGKRVEVNVVVRESALGMGNVSNRVETSWAPAPVSFVRSVLPALSRAGCNSGGCHAKPEGQNGFKLSVFSFDPKSDYNEITREARGRRVFPSAPEQSLFLRKPTTMVPHEGGLRFERGSETHELLVRWLREGMAYSVPGEPSLQGISVFPKERRYRKGARQRLLVQAHYSDGSVWDVTRWAGFTENDKEIATVDERGLITVGSLPGQAVVVARYMGLVADSQLLVPADSLLPAADYARLPKNNFIDVLADAQFERLGLFPSEVCDDAEFLRRVKLDAIGLLPTPDEVRAFLADRGPRKRRQFIARVLEDPAYADYWANQWADLLRPNPDRVGIKSIFTLDQWLRDSFRRNKPYDQFVREILLAEGTNHRDGPAVVYRDRREPPELTTMFSQLFLGTRLECAKCHHHPNEKWSQDDFYQFAAFFSPVKHTGAGLSPPISAGTEIFYFTPGGSVKHPVSGAVMSPRALDGPALAAGSTADPRRALADWLTAPENPFFARAAVNRVWAVFFGQGMVSPVDDFRISNPCSNPELLSALAEDFARHGYDLKHLIRTILESRLYQLSSTPNDSNLRDTRYFSRAYRRRLPAEVLLDAVNDVTGVPDALVAMPPGSRAMQAWSYRIGSEFMDAFGRPNASSDCPCDRDRQLSVVQSLHLMNARNIQAKLSHADGRVRGLAASSRTTREIIVELYLLTLGRPPREDEILAASAPFAEAGVSRQAAAEDVLWALLNSAEFVFNH